MKASIVKSPVGLFAFNEENKVIDYILFPKEINQAVEILKKILNGDYVEQLCIMIKNLKKNNYECFIFEDFRTARSIQEKLGIEYSIENPSRAGETFRAKMNQIVLETKCFEDLNELYNYIHEIYMELTKTTIQQAFSRRDLLLSQAILAFDDIEKTLNLFCNRLREWYGYYFPELDKFIENNNIYLKTISSHIKRNNYTIKNVMAMGVNQDQALQISSLASKSMGADIKENDLNEIQIFAKEVYNLYKPHKRLEDYIDQVMKEIAPNIQNLVGTTLGARLIVLAGGLDNLAMKPASTIQVLGAEKALFRSIRTGTKPPKHGIIFQHKAVHQSPRWQRGKIARVLASKIAIAARFDAYSGTYKGNKLKDDFERRIQEIKRKYERPLKKREKAQ